MSRHNLMHGAVHTLWLLDNWTNINWTGHSKQTLCVGLVFWHTHRKGCDLAQSRAEHHAKLSTACTVVSALLCELTTLSRYVIQDMQMTVFSVPEL